MPVKKIIDIGKSELNKRLRSIELPSFDVDIPRTQFLKEKAQEVTNGTKIGSRGHMGIRDVEPQKAYLWEVRFPNPFRSDGNESSLYAQQTAIPAAIVENIKRYYAGIEYSYPSRDMSPRIFRVTFFDNTEMTNYKFFEAWRQATSNGRHQVKTAPNQHNRDIELRLLDADSSTTVTSFIMYNCRPTEISEASLSYDASNLLTFDVLFYFTHKDLI